MILYWQDLYKLLVSAHYSALKNWLTYVSRLFIVLTSCMYDFLIFAHYFFVFKEFFSENYILDCVLTIIICTFLDQTRLNIYNQVYLDEKEELFTVIDTNLWDWRDRNTTAALTKFPFQFPSFLALVNRKKCCFFPMKKNPHDNE